MNEVCTLHRLRVARHEHRPLAAVIGSIDSAAIEFDEYRHTYLCVRARTVEGHPIAASRKIDAHPPATFITLITSLSYLVHRARPHPKIEQVIYRLSTRVPRASIRPDSAYIGAGHGFRIKLRWRDGTESTHPVEDIHSLRITVLDYADAIAHFVLESRAVVLAELPFVCAFGGHI